MAAEPAAARAQYRRIGPSGAAALARLLDCRRALGITRIADITGLDIASIPVVQAVRPLARSNAVSQGKGGSLAEAAVSAMFESAESFFAERLDRFCVTVASAHSLAIPATRYAAHLLDGVPADWANWDTAWVEASDLLSGRRDLVPLELVHTAYVMPPPPHDGLFRSSTTGLAAGFALADATLHGLLEWVERDAVARSRRRHGFYHRQRIDPATIDDAAVAATLDDLAVRGLHTALWHAPSPIGIPVVICQMMETRPPDHALLPFPAEGSAASGDAAAAALQAIREAAQSRLTAISGARDDFSRRHYPKYPDWAAAAAHLRLLREGPRDIRFEALAPARADTVPQVLERLAAAGLAQAYRVELPTAPLDGLAAAKIVVPGLEPLTEG